VTPDQTAAALLLAAEPADRALAGWQHPVWTDYGAGAMLIPGLSWLQIPSGWALRWREAGKRHGA